MMKSFGLIAGALLFALTLSATDYSKFETYLGYNFVRFNPNSEFVPSFNANGGSGQFAYNFSKWVGVAVDLGAVNRGTLGGGSVDATVIDFVAGPRVTWHNHSRFQPFAQALFGGAYSTASARLSALPVDGDIPPILQGLLPNTPVQVRVASSRTGFAMLAGGGLDIRISKHAAFRPLEADYYLTRMPNILTGNNVNRNNFRYSAGFNFLFGAR
jgi:hypothetical protein